MLSLDEIPPELIINWDQTAIQYVPGPWNLKVQKKLRLPGKMTKADNRCAHWINGW